MTSSTLTGLPSSTISPLPAATSTQASSSGGGGGGPTSSPLLFFVALGFGVVFTNLWIIVGVKYCFRYNQRNRRAMADENGEPIDMTALPRTHRRRREKKLMTMEEVNERFPMLKYKAWMTARAEKGLSTAGGVAAPSGSRPASLRNVDGIIEDSKLSNDVPRPTTPAPIQSSEESNKNDSPESTNKSSPEIDTGEMPHSPTHNHTHDHEHNHMHSHSKSDMPTEAGEEKENAVAAESTVGASTDHVDDDMDDDDQIQMAIPTEIMAMGAGDSCAICIDQLEDDEDVRGLTCGHAFHAHCLDPWLTSRRACCPLCKADYYVPKPRPEGEAAATAEAERQERGRRQSATRMDMPHPPQYAFQRHGGGRILFPNRFRAGRTEEAPQDPQDPQARRGFASRLSRPQRPERVQPPPQPQNSATDAEQPATWRSRMGGMVPNVSAPRFMRRNNNESQAAAGAPEIHTDSNTTPSQLEAGQQ